MLPSAAPRRSAMSTARGLPGQLTAFSPGRIRSCAFTVRHGGRPETADRAVSAPRFLSCRFGARRRFGGFGRDILFAFDPDVESVAEQAPGRRAGAGIPGGLSLVAGRNQVL